MDWSNNSGFAGGNTFQSGKQGKPSKQGTNWPVTGGFTNNTTAETDTLKLEIAKLQYEVTNLAVAVAQITVGQTEIIKHLTMLVARQEQFYREFVAATKGT